MTLEQNETLPPPPQPEYKTVCGVEERSRIQRNTPAPCIAVKRFISAHRLVWKFFY